jgi:hypothetical protein
MYSKDIRVLAKSIRLYMNSIRNKVMLKAAIEVKIATMIEDAIKDAKEREVEDKEKKERQEQVDKHKSSAMLR